MDQNTQLENAPTGENNGLLIPESAIPYLNATRQWTLFFSVLGFIMIALLGFGFVGLLVASSLSPMGSIMAIMAVFYAILMAVYFFPVFYLFKFSDEARKAIASRDQETTQKCFRYLNLHFKITGIITIVFISLYLIAIVALIAFRPMLSNLMNF